MRRLSTNIRHSKVTLPAIMLIAGLALAGGLFLRADRLASTASTVENITKSVAADREVALALQDERRAVASGTAVSADALAEISLATDEVAPSDDAEYSSGIAEARSLDDLDVKVGRYNIMVLAWLDRSIATDPSLIDNAEARRLLVAGGSLAALREAFAVEVATVSTGSASELIDAQTLTDGWIDAVELGAPASIFGDLQTLLGPAAMDELRDAERAALNGTDADAEALDEILADRLAATADLVRLTSEQSGEAVADAADQARRNRLLQPSLALTTTLVLVALWMLLQWRTVRTDTSFGDTALDIARNDFVDLLASVEAGEVDEAMVFPIEAPAALESAAEAMVAFQEAAVTQAIERVAVETNVTHTVAASAGRTRQLIGEQRRVLRDLGDSPIGEGDALDRLDHLISRVAAANDQLLILCGADGLPVPVAGATALSAMVFAAIRSSQEPGRVIVDIAIDATISTELGHDLVTIIRELVDNALAHSSPTHDVVVRGQVHDGSFLLWVCDEGLGLEDASLAELNRDLEEPRGLTGVATDGLGLAVVSELAQRHDLQVALLADAATGVQARVLLPARQIAALGDPRLDPVHLDPARLDPVHLDPALLDDAGREEPLPEPDVFADDFVDVRANSIAEQAVAEPAIAEPAVVTPAVAAPSFIVADFVSPAALDDGAMRSTSASLSHRLLASLAPSDDGGSMVASLAARPERPDDDPFGFGTDR